MSKGTNLLRNHAFWLVKTHQITEIEHPIIDLYFRVDGSSTVKFVYEIASNGQCYKPFMIVIYDSRDTLTVK